MEIFPSENRPPVIPAACGVSAEAQFICLRRERFTVPSFISWTESRLLPVPMATQLMAFSATTVWMPVRAVMS